MMTIMASTQKGKRIHVADITINLNYKYNYANIGKSISNSIKIPKVLGLANTLFQFKFNFQWKKENYSSY